ncbi:GlyGly-CTERM sorting domain-containing protein [Aeromonas sp. 600479]
MAITVQGVNTDNGGKGGEKGGGGGSTGPISLLTLVICGLVRRLKMSR